MRPRTQLLALLGCLAVSAANAYPPAPFFQIYGSVRDDHGNPLSSGTGTVILTGSYAALGTATVSGTGVGVVTIQNEGSGFTSAPTVSFSGGTGTNAIGTAILTDGVVTGVDLPALEAYICMRYS